MKIHYVKNNSERAKAFQLKTIIFEQDGQKYIKKQALTSEAIPHLKKMKESYTKLTNAIVHSKLKLAPIINETSNSLTFEFIEGQSLEERYNQAKKHSPKAQEEVLDSYIDLVKTAFKISKYSRNDKTYQTLFGALDFTPLEDEMCFDTVSNIDLIFSNIIYSDENIYLIDYEWVFDVSLPIDYIIHRMLLMLDGIDEHPKYRVKHSFLYLEMERHFVDKYVMQDGFYFQRHQYIKTNAPIVEHIAGKEAHIQELVSHVEGQKKQLEDLSTHIQSLDSAIEIRDEQISFLFRVIDSLGIQSRIKKYVPQSILNKLGFSKSPFMDMQQYPLPNPDDIQENTQVRYTYHTPKINDEIKNTLTSFHHNPLISIIMPVYNVDTKWLDLAIQSIEAQWYENWELCIADDKSTKQETLEYLKNINNPKIKITYLDHNLNISGASNAGLKLATGEYIALMDNDDEITPDALYEMVKVINKKDADFIYSDEDFISMEEVYINPHFKADFSPDLLLSHNYITHFTCFKKSLLDKVGLFDSYFDGAQDYDLFLRLTEKTSKIYHIPKVLYHWRMLETSTSSNSEAKPEAIERGRLVLETTLKRRNIDATVEHANLNHYFRVKYKILNTPLVSIIMPFKDRPELLELSITSVLEKSSYKNYEIIGISNNSQENATYEMMASLEDKDKRVSFYEYNTEFNYADINNHAVNTYAKGEHILLLNNDIEIIAPDWIESMLEFSQREDVGCVGAKLFYPNETIQHAGIIIGLGGYAAHSHRESPRNHAGYFNRLNIIQNISCVTAACLMIKKSVYQEVEGMNAIEFKIGYNDVDFNLRVREKGYLNIFTPYAQMYHHESLSRGEDDTPEKIARFQTEKDALFARHKEILTHGDPYYNINLTLDKEDFSLC